MWSLHCQKRVWWIHLVAQALTFTMLELLAHCLVLSVFVKSVL